jgi:hypothetical protein
VTWQPESDHSGEEPPAGWAVPAAGEPAGDLLPGGQDEAGGGYSAYPGPPPRRGRWAAIVAVLALGLCGLAGGAAGAVRQLLPREFSPAQQQQIKNWEMSRRWRVLQAGQIFPAAVGYQVAPGKLNGTQGLGLTARRLGIAPQSSCGPAVSAAAVAVLRAAHCAAMLRATYVDATGSMVVTLGVAVLPNSTAARNAAPRLAAAVHDQGLAVHAFPVARSPAASFRQPQRQFSTAYQLGPYVVLATAGFTDGRRRVQLNTDDYYEEEMSSLASGLANSIAHRLGKSPLLEPTCPGAPGC